MEPPPTRNPLNHPAMHPDLSDGSATPQPEVRAFFPGVVSARFHQTWDFYTEVLGFRTVSEWDTYVHLEHPSGAQISVLQHETDGHPAELVCATDGRGIWLHLEVTDAVQEHERLRAAGVPLASRLEQRRGGEHQFAVRDPNGILILVTQRVSRPRQPDLELAEVG